MPQRTALLVAWCLVLALGGAWTSSRFQLSTDLRAFMPEPRTEAQRLLLQNIGESPASRVLLLSLEGAEPGVLSGLSNDLARQLAASLGKSGDLIFVSNGSGGLDSIPEALLSYRYLLTDSFDSAPLDEHRLSAALEERAHDLASPAAPFLEDLLPRDPTLEALHLAEQWQPAEEPRRVDGAWFTRDGRRALLLVETRAAAFDPDGQGRVLDLIRAEFERVRGAGDAELRITGSGYFSATIKRQMQREAAAFGFAAALGLMLLMAIAYRRASYLLLGALPLISGGLAGLILVGAAFESVHGITLAFGFTLIGVAQDYPMHLFSHLRHDQPPLQAARSLSKPLLTGVASTCIAYLAFLVSGVIGLAQLACLTVTGLLVAAACTRFALPRLIVNDAPVESSQLLLDLDARLLRLPRLEWTVIPLVLICVGALYFARGPFWENDLSRLAPVPESALRFDAELRRELPTPDLRHLLVVSGDAADAVLARLEAMDGDLRRLADRGIVGGFEHAAQFLPSAATQRRRQLALPSADALRTMVRVASGEAGFADEVFEPFVRDVTQARDLPLLDTARMADTPLGTRVGALLFERDGRWHGLVTFAAIRDAATLATDLGALPAATFLDLKQASQELVAAQRAHILRCLGIAAIALIAVVFVALRSVRRAWRVLAPMLLTTLLIIAVLRAGGVSLSLFHLISLVLAAGLGLDYALFFEHFAAEEKYQERTLHALLVCAISTLLVFALLAFSAAPVLKALGVTVSIGVVGNFLLGLAISRHRRVERLA